MYKKKHYNYVIILNLGLSFNTFLCFKSDIKFLYHVMYFFYLID